MPLTVGTAGHIDHGKTRLVEALTGKNTDRLPEERRRGISIALGYAPLVLPDGRRLSLVDVPGHERFVRTMVAGATGIDRFLLVVDAAEGARPQTHEHLAILRLLGIERGVVAVTKADLVDDETLELALEEARDLVPGAEAVAVSAKTGAGLEELVAAIGRVAERSKWLRATKSPRLGSTSTGSSAFRGSARSRRGRSGAGRSRPETCSGSSRAGSRRASAASRSTTRRSRARRRASASRSRSPASSERRSAVATRSSPPAPSRRASGSTWRCGSSSRSRTARASSSTTARPRCRPASPASAPGTRSCGSTGRS